MSVKTMGFVAGVLLLAMPAASMAQSDDPPAPSLEVRTDAPAVHYRLAVSADPLAAFFGDYGIRVEGTLSAASSLFARPAYAVGAEHDAIGVEGGCHLWLLGDGLSGPYLGPVAGLAVDTARVVTLSASLEAGWQWIWQGIVLGAAGGATWSHTTGQTSDVSLRVTLALGYAWM